MPRLTIPSLENELGQRLVTAASAAAMTYLRPARFPKWVRRSITMSNSLTAVGAALAGAKQDSATRQLAKSNVGKPAASQTVTVREGVPVSQAGANWASSAAAGMAFVTSGIALAADKRIERFLIKRGVANPRLLMAVGAAAISLASPYVTRQIQQLGAKLSEKGMPKDVLDARLRNPLGTSESQERAIPASNANTPTGNTPVRSDSELDSNGSTPSA